MSFNAITTKGISKGIFPKKCNLFTQDIYVSLQQIKFMTREGFF